MFSIQYRPMKFSEMIGQKGIIHEMSNRSKKMNYPNVMIFEGNSGTGKTTLAFIIASILNCENLIEESDGTKSPCGKCISCESIKNQQFIRDTAFFDASQMGKDNVIGLNDIAHSAPMYDKNRIIIIDEAQELSRGGKGATLNLLEKKRVSSNLFFILCTMDVHSFDPAIVSRGQVYKFRKVDYALIARYLYDLLKVEKIDMDVPEEFISDGVFILAENCGGNVRTALQNLERCINGEFFTKQQISEEFNFISKDQLVFLAEKMLKRDPLVLKELQNYDIKETYFKLYKILVDAMVYQVSNFVNEKWKEFSCKKLASYVTLHELINVFVNSNGGYFKENLFLVNLVQYLLVNPIPILHPVGKPAKVRKVLK